MIEVKILGSSRKKAQEMGTSENSEEGRRYINISSIINRRRTSEVKIVGD